MAGLALISWFLSRRDSLIFLQKKLANGLLRGSWPDRELPPKTHSALSAHKYISAASHCLSNPRQSPSPRHVAVSTPICWRTKSCIFLHSQGLKARNHPAISVSGGPEEARTNKAAKQKAQLCKRHFGASFEKKRHESYTPKPGDDLFTSPASPDQKNKWMPSRWIYP